MLAAGGNIDGPAVRRGNLDIAFGAEELAGHREAVPAEAVGSQKGRVYVLKTPQITFQEQRSGNRAPAEQLNDPAQGVRAVKLGGPSAQYFYTVQCNPGNAAPVHPSSEGIIDGHAVGQNQAAARAAGTHAAHRHSLGSGVRHQAAGAAEKSEARHLTKKIVHCLGRTHLLLLPREYHDALRGARHGQRGARSNNSDRIGQP